MKTRGTYALLALFFAGLIGLWAANLAQIPTRAILERTSHRILAGLVDTKPDDLRKVEILGGEDPLVFERGEGNHWQMTSPMDVAADPSKVETLAYNLKELTRRPDAATLDGDPAKFGMAPPERIIRLWGTATDAPIASLDVGKVSLDRRYVRATGAEGVEVVDAKGLDLLKLPPTRWRDHEIFRVPSFEVDAIRISAGGEDLKFGRTRKGWHILAPYKVPAAEARVDALIADLGSLRVLDDSRFVADDVPIADLGRYGLKDPVLTIEVDAGRVVRRPTKQVLRVGKPVEGKEGQVYVLREGQDDVLAVESRVLKDLRPDPISYRSPKVADINVARVIRIEVEKPSEGDGFEAVRTPNGWAILRPSPAYADRQAVQDFLKSLDQLQTSTYLPTHAAAELGLEKPSMVLKIWEAPDPQDTSGQPSADPNGELAMTLQVGRRDIPRKAIYVRIEGDPNILVLPDSAHDFLPRTSLAFRDRRMLAVAADKIERIKFEGPGRRVTLIPPILKNMGLGKIPIGWWLVDPVTAPADSRSVGQLLKLLANYRAETLVAESAPDLDKFGLKTPTLIVTWSNIAPISMIAKPAEATSPPARTPLEDHALLIGSPVPNRPNLRYAKLGDRPIIFTVGMDLLAVLDSEWHDHRVLSFDPKQVRKVQLDWPDRDLVLKLVEEGSNRKWTLQGSVDSSTLDPGRLLPLLESASRLETMRFAQYTGEFHEVAGLKSPQLTIRFELDDGSPAPDPEARRQGRRRPTLRHDLDRCPGGGLPRAHFFLRGLDQAPEASRRLARGRLRTLSGASRPRSGSRLGWRVQARPLILEGRAPSFSLCLASGAPSCFGSCLTRIRPSATSRDRWSRSMITSVRPSARCSTSCMNRTGSGWLPIRSESRSASSSSTSPPTSNSPTRSWS